MGVTLFSINFNLTLRKSNSWKALLQIWSIHLKEIATNLLESCAYSSEIKWSDCLSLDSRLVYGKYDSLESTYREISNYCHSVTLVSLNEAPVSTDQLWEGVGKEQKEHN